MDLFNFKKLKNKIFYKQQIGDRRILTILGLKFSFFKKAKAIYLGKVLKENLGLEISNFRALGIAEQKREKKLIVSMTSFPERIYDIHFSIYSLLNQTVKPDEVILWLGVEQFPNAENDVPQSVLNLVKNGLTIKWCEDIKSYKKLIPALKEYPNDIIVTADDDIYYALNWLELLYEAYSKEPELVHCHRVKKITFNEKGELLPYSNWNLVVNNTRPSFLNFFTGCGGVLYPPKTLYKDIFDKDLFNSLCPHADDIWFWAMAVLNGTKINIVDNHIEDKDLIHVSPERDSGSTGETTLYEINGLNGQNDVQFRNIFNHYPQIKEVVCFNSSEFWENRYIAKGDSGAGSYGRLAQFKADIINKFVKQKEINSVIEFGVGDGNQLSLLDLPSYIGYDVSDTILKNTSAMFVNDSTKTFKQVQNYNGEQAELTMSLDVVYHLIEDKIFNEYMQNLFGASSKYVIVYASNEDKQRCQHVRHRKFTDWVEENKKEWTLLEYIPNIYPYKEEDSINTSFADFYIYTKLAES